MKIFLFPPAGMSNREAYDTATKILIGGIVTLAGVVLEESLKAFLITIPIISALATEISSILCGLLTGIAMSLIFSILDKIDLFGVKDEKRHIFIIKKLTEMENLADREHKTLLSEFNSLEDEFNMIDHQIKMKIKNL